jgi:alcohol dehydrogenase class IV
MHRLLQVLSVAQRAPWTSASQQPLDLATRLGAPTSLSKLGLEPDAIEAVAKIVAPRAGTAPVSNPRDFAEEDVKYLLLQAYLGKRPQAERNRRS